MPISEQELKRAETICNTLFRAKVCECCGETYYTSRPSSSRLCSNKCRQAAFQSGKMKKEKANPPPSDLPKPVPVIEQKKEIEKIEDVKKEEKAEEDFILESKTKMLKQQKQLIKK